MLFYVCFAPPGQISLPGLNIFKMFGLSEATFFFNDSTKVRSATFIHCFKFHIEQLRKNSLGDLPVLFMNTVTHPRTIDLPLDQSCVL